MGLCKECKKDIPNDADDSAGFCDTECWSAWVLRVVPPPKEHYIAPAYWLPLSTIELGWDPAMKFSGTDAAITKQAIAAVTTDSRGTVRYDDITIYRTDVDDPPEES